MLTDKRAQIAETMTWVVATIIILVILAIAIFAASAMGKLNRSITLETDEPSILIKKSLQGYLLTEDEKGGSVLLKLEAGDFDSFSEKLGEEVFIDPQDESTYTLRLLSLAVSKHFNNKIRIDEENILVVSKI